VESAKKGIKRAPAMPSPRKPTTRLASGALIRRTSENAVNAKFPYGKFFEIALPPYGVLLRDSFKTAESG
jgi:hypothetical protein